MSHLALHVYFWGSDEQTRLLSECLGPAARELRDEGLLDRFWFTSFDTRGPHVFALFTPPHGHSAELRARLGARLDGYLAGHPSTTCLAPEEVERRHAECRGKQLSAIDAEPGFAPNNSYRMADHPGDRYPFRLSAGAAAEDELWWIVQDVVFWAIGQRRARTSAAGAIRWLAEVDRALARAGAEPAEFWRHHATTLLVFLQARLDADEAGVLAALPAAVGERNRELFDRHWAPPAPGPSAERLAEIVLADDGRPPGQRQALMREINHCTLAQLGLPVMHHIPLVLYAWQRNLPPHAA
jgi:hypothetical protein